MGDVFPRGVKDSKIWKARTVDFWRTNNFLFGRSFLHVMRSGGGRPKSKITFGFFSTVINTEKKR